MRIIHLANRHHDEPSAGHGHWLNREYKNSCVREDAEFFLVAPKVSVDPQSYPLFVLDRHARGRLTYFPLLGLKTDFKRLRLLLQGSPKDSILHVYEGGLREFLLVSLLVSEFGELKSVFNFNLADPWHTAVRSKNWIVKYLWKQINALVVYCNKSVVYTAETKELASLLGARIVLPLREYALPPNVPFELSVRKIKKDWDFFIPVFGASELGIVMDALHELKRRTGKIYRVRIQPRWSGSLSPTALIEVDELDLELLPKVISQEEYVNTLIATSVVVLPYKNLEYYRFQSSGRVQDAVSLGAKVIVPATTSLSRQVLEASWGYEFDSDSFLSLADAMEESLREQNEVSPKYKVVSPFESIVSQANQAGSFPGVGHWSGSQEKRLGVRLMAASLLFLLSDFRSLVAGILGLLGVSQNIQVRLANAMPRKQK